MDWLEDLTLPDGQYAKLLKRLPNERAMAINTAVARERAVRDGGLIPVWDPVFADAVAKAVLWEARLKDYLTGNWVDANEYGKADPRVSEKIQVRAIELYVEWYREAYAGPKDSSETGLPTPPSENPAPETDAAS